MTKKKKTDLSPQVFVPAIPCHSERCQCRLYLHWRLWHW